MSESNLEPGRSTPGHLLEGALHLFDRQLNGEQARALGLVAAVATVIVSTLAAIATAVGGLFLTAAGADWLKENVPFFEHHPRLGGLVGYAVIVLTFAVGVVVGRASVWSGRPRQRRR